MKTVFWFHIYTLAVTQCSEGALEPTCDPHFHSPEIDGLDNTPVSTDYHPSNIADYIYNQYPLGKRMQLEHLKEENTGGN